VLHIRSFIRATARHAGSLRVYWVRRSTNHAYPSTCLVPRRDLVPARPRLFHYIMSATWPTRGTIMDMAKRSVTSVQPNLFSFFQTNKVKRKKNEEPDDSSSDSESEPEFGHQPPGSASARLRGDETNVSTEVTNPNRTERQDNYVTVEKPSGSTTIIINNQLETSADGESTSSTDPTFSRQPSGVVSDIAQGIL